MANVSSAMVTIVRSWPECGTSGHDRVGMLVRLEETTAGIAAGGNSNTIPASAFGLTKVESCGNLLVYTTSTGASVKMYPMAPSFDGAIINAIDVTNATDGNRFNVADVAIATTQRGLMEIHGYR